jgi:mitochondrial import receptor subunit TOM20
MLSCFLGLALPAALSFFRAMRVYPEPLQLVVILEKTLPEDMFRIVMDLMSRDVSASSAAPASEKSGSSARGSRTKRKAGNGSSPRGPPSEASSQEWDRVTEPDASVSSLPSSNA